MQSEWLYKAYIRAGNILNMANENNELNRIFKGSFSDTDMSGLFILFPFRSFTNISLDFNVCKHVYHCFYVCVYFSCFFFDSVSFVRFIVVFHQSLFEFYLIYLFNIFLYPNQRERERVMLIGFKRKRRDHGRSLRRGTIIRMYCIKSKDYCQ